MGRRAWMQRLRMRTEPCSVSAARVACLVIALAAGLVLPVTPDEAWVAVAGGREAE